MLDYLHPLSTLSPSVFLIGACKFPCCQSCIFSRSPYFVGRLLASCSSGLVGVLEFYTSDTLCVIHEISQLRVDSFDMKYFVLQLLAESLRIFVLSRSPKPFGIIKLYLGEELRLADTYSYVLDHRCYQ